MMSLWKKFLVAMFMMMAVAVAVSAAPTKKTSTIVQNMYLGDLNNPKEKMKVDMFVANRRITDKNNLTGYTKRYAADLKKKVPTLTGVDVVICRLYGPGKADRHCDLIVAFEVYICRVPSGAYAYVWINKVDYNGEKDEKGLYPETWEQSQMFYDLEEMQQWVVAEAKKYDPNDEAVSILEMQLF